MKKIGFVDYYISEWHANNYPNWIKELSDEYEVAYVWAELDVSPSDGVTTDEWCEKMGVKKCDTIDKLCQKSDFIFILAPDNAETHLRYAKAVLPYGKPTYIDKTFAPDLATTEAIFDIADTPFFSTSALRYATELNEVKDSDNVTMIGSARDFEVYAIHLAEMAIVHLGCRVASVSAKRVGNHRFYFITGENGKTVNLVYAPGAKYTLLGKGSDGKDKQVNVTSEFFKGLIADILRFFENGKQPFEPSQTLEVMRLRDMLLNGD